MKRVLILGIGGQDGSYLTDILLERGHDVYGLHRRVSGDNLARVRHHLSRVCLHHGDLSDGGSIDRVVRDVEPEWIFNVADQDHVGWSSSCPDYSVNVTAGAVGRLLETVRNFDDTIRIFQPVSATMFGNHKGPTQDEDARLDPRSPYACAKAHAYHLCRHYRVSHGLRVSCGIMYNHDSPRRGPEFLLQEICRKAIRVGTGQEEKFLIGDPDAQVDIGFAGDYMEATVRMLEHPEPDDFVIGSGDTDRVGNLCEEALRQVGGLRVRVERDPSYERKDQGLLCSDISKIKKTLDWQPTVGTRELIGMILKRYVDAS